MGLNAMALQSHREMEGKWRPLASHKSQPWYAAYMAALFEADRSKIRERIRHAELLIMQRERELFTTANDFGEHQALNGALHALRALRSCLGV